jgi:chromosome partitioning protein
MVNAMNRERVLSQYVNEVKRNYNYVLIDCMPSLGMLTVNALTAADSVLIPAQPQYLSAKGLEQLLQTINKVRRQINPKLKIEGILLTMVDGRTNYAKGNQRAGQEHLWQQDQCFCAGYSAFGPSSRNECRR